MRNKQSNRIISMKIVCKVIGGFTGKPIKGVILLEKENAL